MSAAARGAESADAAERRLRAVCPDLNCPVVADLRLKIKRHARLLVAVHWLAAAIVGGAILIVTLDHDPT